MKKTHQQQDGQLSSGFIVFWNDQSWLAVNKAIAIYYTRIADDRGRSQVGNDAPLELTNLE